MSETEVLELDLWRQSYMAVVRQTQTGCAVPVELKPVQSNNPENTTWAEFSILTGKSGRAELGGGKRALQKQVAMAQFLLFAPENQGDGELVRIGNRIKRLWDEIQVQVPPVGYWKTEMFRVQRLGTQELKKGFVSVVVDGPMVFWFRNGNAPLDS